MLRVFLVVVAADDDDDDVVVVACWRSNEQAFRALVVGWTFVWVLLG